MHGLIGRIKATPGKRDALVAILLENSDTMPGCLSYIVALDPSDADAIWVTEVWDTEASQRAALQLPSVVDAISRGRPLITAFDHYIQTLPVGGLGT